MPRAFRLGHVLQQVRGEQRVERVRAGVLGGEEVLDRVRLEALRAAELDRGGVVVDPDAVATDVRQVAPDCRSRRRGSGRD